jgi:hypothetical protein
MGQFSPLDVQLCVGLQSDSCSEPAVLKPAYLPPREALRGVSPASVTLAH